MTTPSEAYYDTQEEALEEVRRRRSSVGDDALLTRCERTGYGNWRVVSVPAEFVVDTVADGPSPDLTDFGLRPRRSNWASG